MFQQRSGMTSGRRLRAALLLVCVSAALLLPAACRPRAAITEVPTVLPIPTATVRPTAPRVGLSSLEATATTAPPPASVATLSAGLSATVAAGMPPTATPDPTVGPTFDGIEGVKVLPVMTGAEADPKAWIAFTYGISGLGAGRDHFVAIYTRADNAWQEASRFTLATADYLGPESVLVAPFGAGESIWLEVQSGVGAHGGCFDLLRFDGTTLFSEVENCNSSPFAGAIQDLDGDGLPRTVVLNQTDNYVFCYACGVRLLQFEVQRYEDGQMEEVPLRLLPESAPDDLRRLNNRAVELAQAGLWKDARETINQIPAPIDDEIVAWNARLIRLHAEARAEQARDGAYPLLENIFYGDYAAAMEIMRSLSVERIFGRPTPLVAGTVADGWEQSLTERIMEATTPAIQARPDLAAAFFLRGWAIHLLDDNDPAILDTIERAAQMDPGEPLFQQSVDYLRRGQGPPLLNNPDNPDAPPEEGPAEGDSE
ncbi:MAG: hypothetical protein ACLFVO_20365 [Chloroflexaceae bacterium]